MSTIKRIALASAVSMTMLSSISFAAVSGQMQGAANAQAQAITKAVNVSNASIQCKQATLRIASAAKAKAGNVKGAALRTSIMEATSNAATKFGIAADCVTPVNVAKAASQLTGMYPATGPTMGLAKAGAASGTTTGMGGMGALAGIAGLVGIAAVIASSDDDAVVTTTTSTDGAGVVTDTTTTVVDGTTTVQAVVTTPGVGGSPATTVTTTTVTAANGAITRTRVSVAANGDIRTEIISVVDGIETVTSDSSVSATV